MSGVAAKAQTASIALVAATKKTVLQLLAAANHRALVNELSASFDGTSNTAQPVLVEITRQSDAGTGGSALTPAKNNVDDTETLQTTALENIVTVEPVEADVLMSEHVHPQGGWTWQAPFGKDIVINGGDRLGVAMTAAAGVNVVTRANFEE